ncbi:MULTISPECIES: peptide chain release factor N(5)-glutamine methyltransferase [unclassified Iodidimonas]|jgi:release factor glutamine methyltransferase|uniref:peptide chain release factor N(5)-glutamine methyltransferase n=1 Tax=unclassified Iodidimonas TaxID=2626145 RepID=UPI002482844E|nr:MULTISPECIES: peptide chain release factor N(5)-glutamine methyltransferase [unclassified Iodidimonas]
MPDHPKAEGLTVAALLRGGLEKLISQGIETARLDAQILLAHALGRSRMDLVLYPAIEPGMAEVDAYHALIDRRMCHEPIAYLVGKREFHGHDFSLNHATLIPRPDSETLVDAVLDQVPDRDGAYRILDLGTGSGCLLLSLLMALPKARGLGLDISADALLMARRNAENLGCGLRADFLESDWLAGVPHDGRSYDIIISNPPYIPHGDVQNLMADVRDHEPLRALDGGADGLDVYRALMGPASHILADGGLLAFEVGAGQADAVAQMIASHCGTTPQIYKDLAGFDRVVLASKAGLPVKEADAVEKTLEYDSETVRVWLTRHGEKQ